MSSEPLTAATRQCSSVVRRVVAVFPSQQRSPVHRLPSTQSHDRGHALMMVQWLIFAVSGRSTVAGILGGLTVLNTIAASLVFHGSRREDHLIGIA